MFDLSVTTALGQLQRGDPSMHWWTSKRVLFSVAALVSVITAAVGGTAVAASKTERASFDMIVSAGAATCLPHATADVRIHSLGPVEVMRVAGEFIKSDEFSGDELSIAPRAGVVS